MSDLAARAAWFHRSHPVALLISRSKSDPDAWQAYVAWMRGHADPQSTTPGRCECEIRDAR